MLTQRQTATSTTRSQAAPRPQKLPYALPCHTPILPQQPLICSLSLQVHIFKNVLLKASRTLQPLGTGWLHSARCLWASFPRLRSILSNDVPACPSSPSLTRMSMVPIGFGDYNQGCYKHDKVLCEPKFSFLHSRCPWWDCWLIWWWQHSYGKSEELKSLLMKVKEETEKAGLKLNIQKTKITTSGPITSRQTDGETVETVADFIFLGSKITADGDYIHEIKRVLFLGRKFMTNLFGEGNGTPLRYFCLENPMGGGAW